VLAKLVQIAITELTLHNSVSILKEQLSEEDEIKIYSH
jgi:hypothetical protein